MNNKQKPTTYQTLIVTFAKPISSFDAFFEDWYSWGASSLKEWVDGYENTRFTQVDERKAVITSKKVMKHVHDWLVHNMPIESKSGYSPQK